MIVWDHADHRVRHPCGDGDHCLVLELGARAAADCLGGLRRHRDVALPLSPQLQMAVAMFAAAVRREPHESVVEQAALGLIDAIASGAAGARSTEGAARGEGCAASPGAARRLALAAIELIHRDLAVNRSVAELAEEIGCSPFHLMHAFRAGVGDTVRAYRVRARLGVALHRLAEGCDDLTALAMEVGFASHSHLTDTFVRELGLPPSQLRARLQEPRGALQACELASS
jgi:AraC-like DNA-binding protein